MSRNSNNRATSQSDSERLSHYTAYSFGVAALIALVISAMVMFI